MRTAPAAFIGASRAAYHYVLFGLGPILVICAAAVLMPDLLLRTVYGPSSPYLAVAVGLQLLAVAGVLDYIAEMISKTLLGVQAGRLAFVVNVVAVGGGAGAGIGAHRPAGRVRCVPRPADRQHGARDRRHGRDRVADHSMKGRKRRSGLRRTATRPTKAMRPAEQ